MRKQTNSLEIASNRAYRRHHDREFGSARIPAILATRSEAPSISRASTLSQHNKIGRPLHALSQPELAFMLLGLFAPDTVDILEQLVLEPFAAPHPIVGHPLQGGTDYPDLQGIVSVAKRLNVFHKLRRYKTVSKAGEKVTRLVPMIGDILLITGKRGALRAINWNIKANSQDFERACPGLLQPRHPERRAEAATRRNLIEDLYYLDAGIPSYRLAADQLDAQFVENLKVCYCGSAKGYKDGHRGFENILRREVLPLYKDCISVRDAYVATSARLGIPYQHYRDYWYSCIWRRSVRIDLFSPLYLNGPTYPERKDPLDVYADWFRGGAA